MNAIAIAIFSCICAVLFEQYALGAVPKQKINIGTLNVRASAFVTDVNPALIQINNMKSLEPPACERLRREVQRIVRSFETKMLTEFKITGIALAASRILDAEQNTDLASLTTAYQTATTNITTVGQTYLTNINTRCAELNANAVLNNASTALQDMIRQQRVAGTQIAALTKQFDDEVQDRYVPVEDFINKP